MKSTQQKRRCRKCVTKYIRCSIFCIFFFYNFNLAYLSISHVSNTSKKYVTGILDQGMMSLRSAIFSSRFVNAPLNEVFALEPNNHRFFFQKSFCKNRVDLESIELGPYGKFYSDFWGLVQNIESWDCQKIETCI